MVKQSNNSKATPSTRQPAGTDSFVESMRSIGNSTLSSVKNDLLKPGARDIFDSILPFSSPQRKSQADQTEGQRLDKNNERENIYARKQFEIVKREERVVFTRKERETQAQVQNLQQEIKSLAAATGTLAKEVQIATMQEEVNPGTYHTNFLLRLLAIVKALKFQVQESSSWLASFNKKSKKQKSYWNQFKKSGSSFSLHHDRAVATQVG